MKNAKKRIVGLLLAAVMSSQLFTGCDVSGLSTKIKVSYMTGSNEYVVQEYDLNDQITLPAEPKIEGQKFIGWYTDEACTQPYAEGKITKGLVLYAKFEPSVVYIIVNTDGGEKIPMQAIVPGGQYTLPEAKKEGYTFTGYYYIDKNGDKQDFPTSGVLPFDTDTVVTASYTINKYAITLHDGFSAEPTVATVEYNSLYNPNKATRPGYTFVAWHTTATNQTEETVYDVSKPVKSNMDLYAQYTANNYTITIANNVDSTTEQVRVTYDEEYALTPVAKTGYNFVGYEFNGEEFAAQGTYTHAQDVRITAKYATKTYAVTFKDAATGQVITTKNVEHGKTVSEPTKELTKTGYSYTLSADLGAAITADTEITVTYKANDYKITIISSVAGIAPVTVDVAYDGTYTLTPQNVAGYTFQNFMLDGEVFAATGTYKYLQNITIFANYALNEYTVTFKDAATGEVLATQGVSHGGKVTEPNLNKVGYSYTLSADLSAAITANTEVLVTYKANDYKITVISNVAGANYVPVDVAYDGAYTLTAQDVEGYTFQNFTLDGKEFNAKGTYTYLQNITVMANYTLNAYTVTFKDAATGEVITTKGAEHGKTVSEPTKELTKTGYSYTLSADLSAAITADTEVLVTYKANEYQIVIISNVAGANYVPVDVAYDGTYTLTAQEVEGYTFQNFTLDGKEFNANGTYKYLQNITIIANYTLNEYTVTFKDAETGDVLATQAVSHGGKVAEPNLNRFGYTYTLSADLNTAITADTEITVTYTAKTAIVTVKGAQDDYVLPTIVYGETFTLAEPTKAGHNFEHFTGSNGKTYEANVEYECDFESLILTAEFDGDEKTVTFYVDGAVSGEEIVVLRGETVARPATDPVKAGYTFKGWSSVENEYTQYDFSKGVEKNTNIYAYFEANTYTITINLDGGAGKTSLTVTYDAVYDLATLGTPTKKGYTFDGYDYPTTDTYKVVGNTEIVAQWKEDWKTVTFNADGNVSTTNVLNGFVVAAPATAPEKVGYTFKGWYVDQEFATEYDFSAEVTENVSLYAKFEANTYTITINLDGGAGKTSLTVTYGQEYDLEDLGTPTKKGYTFDGYNYPITGKYTVAGNTEIVAQWKEDWKTVTFNADGNVSTTKVLNGFAVAAPATVPQKVGYTFKGWYVDQEFATEYDFSAEVTENVSLYAKFEANTYTITINLDGGAGKTSLTVTYDAVYDLATLGTPTKKGYIFAGYDYPITGKYTVAGNTEIVAQWTADEKTVTFNADGNVSTTEVLNGFTVQQPNDPSKEGYTFKGWYIDQAFTTKYDFSAEVTENVSLYAKFEANTYTITINLDGGAGKTSLTVTYDAVYDLATLGTPTKKGYIFAGYDYPITGKYTVAGNTEIVAQWKEDWKTVTFNADGNVSTTKVLNGFAVAAPATVPQKVGYTFVCWKLGDNIWDFSTEVTTDITLTAYFTVNTYTLTIDNAGGIGAATLQIEYGSAYNLTAPTKEGYEFVRYERNGAEFALSGDYDYAESITITAVWKKILSEGTWWNDEAEKGAYVYLVGYKYTFSNTGLEIKEFISGDYSCVSISGGHNAVLEAKAPCEFKVTVSKYDIEGNVTESYEKTMRIVEAVASFTTGSDYANAWVKKNRTNFDNQEKNDVMVVGREDFRPDVKVEKLVNDKLVALTLAEASVDVKVLANGVETNDYTMNGNSFTFGEALVGKTITVELSPRYAVYDTQAATFEFVLNNGVNVYDNETFKAAYANKDVSVINVLRNITLELSEDQIVTATGNETSKSHEGTTWNFSVEAGTKAPKNSSGGTGVYERASGDLTVNGNYFTADGSQVLLVDNRIDDWHIFGTSKNGYILQNVQFSLFKFGDWNTFGDDTLEMSNLYIIGNMGEAVNYGQNDGETYKITVGGNSYNMLTMSGAAQGIQARNANVSLDNVTIRRTVIGFHAYASEENRTTINPASDSLHTTVFNVKDAIIEQNWANAVYVYGTCLVTLDSCVIGTSSGPAVHIDALPTASNVNVNSKLVLKNGTTITNILAGNETWFNAYDMSGLVGSMKSMVEDAVQGLNQLLAYKYQMQANYTILQKDANGTEKINLAILVLAGGGNTVEWQTDPDKMPTVDVEGLGYVYSETEMFGFDYVKFDTSAIGMTGENYIQGYLGLYSK